MDMNIRDTSLREAVAFKSSRPRASSAGSMWAAASSAKNGTGGKSRLTRRFEKRLRMDFR